MKKEQGQNLAAGAAAMLVAEPVLALAHTGGPGILVGIAVGAAAYLFADELRQVKYAAGEEPPPAATDMKKNSLVYRLMNGKSVRGDGQPNRTSQIVLSPDLRLDRSEIIAKSIFVVGQRRSGKTTLAALLAEQIGACNVPMFIPDSEGDLLSVYELLPRGVIAAAPGSRWEDSKGANVWIVTPEDADVLGFQILYEGMQVILDMNTFEDDEAWQVVIGVIDGLFEFAKQYPDQLCPVEVFLDEAQKYLPQDLNTSAIRDADIRDDLLDRYRDVIATGGKRGITPVILTQRFAETNNKIMAQSELRFILRQTQDNDLARCVKYVRSETATAQQIASFTKGQGVFVGEDGTQLVTTFNQRKSDGSRSGTPGVEAVERFAHTPLTFQRPATRSVRHEEEPRTLAPRPAPRQKVDSLVVRGADAWMAGQQSIDKLAYALGLNFNQARQLKPKVLDEVKRRQMTETAAEEQA